MKRRSVVITTGRIPRHGRPVIWGYGMADLAVLLGTTVEGVRKLIPRKRFDPADLASVVAFVGQRGGGERREALSTALTFTLCRATL